MPKLATIKDEEVKKDAPTPLPVTILPTAQYLLTSFTDPLRDNLTRDQLENAIRDKLVKYPATLRSPEDDPITNHSHSLITFLLFKEPRITKRGKKVYGYFKVRGGGYSSDSAATAAAAKIIREQDSKCVNRILEIGKYLPITDDDIFDKDKLTVKDSNDDEKEALRDQASKEAEQTRARIMNEIRERERECKQGDIYDDKTSPTYYSMRRVTEMRLTEAITQQIQSISENLRVRNDVRKELRGIEEEHKEYPDIWLEIYNAKRREAGIPDFNPASNKFDDYNAWNMNDAVQSTIKYVTSEITSKLERGSGK